MHMYRASLFLGTCHKARVLQAQCPVQQPPEYKPNNDNSACSLCTLTIVIRSGRRQSLSWHARLRMATQRHGCSGLLQNNYHILLRQCIHNSTHATLPLPPV